MNQISTNIINKEYISLLHDNDIILSVLQKTYNLLEKKHIVQIYYYTHGK